MKKQKENRRSFYFKIVLFAAFLFAFQAFSSSAQAQTLCAGGSGTIQVPTGAPVTSHFGRRSAPTAGASSSHKGTDYGTPRGSTVSLQQGCEPKPNTSGGLLQGSASSSAGFYLLADCGTNQAGQPITLRYLHLDTADAYNPASRLITTGGSGVGTGPHLHFEVIIGGNAVDAECVISGVRTDGGSCPASGAQNICDGQVANALIQDAQQKAGGSTGVNTSPGAGSPGTGTGGTTTTPNPGGGTTTTTTSPGGSTTTTTTFPNGSSTSTTVTPAGVTTTTVTNADGSSITITTDATGNVTSVSTTPPTNPGSSAPTPCGSSTCITQQIIDMAKNTNFAHADYTQPTMRYDWLGAQGGCQGPIPTGATTYRMTSSATSTGPATGATAGTVSTHTDATCSNDGCAYIVQGNAGTGQCQQ